MQAFEPGKWRLLKKCPSCESYLLIEEIDIHSRTKILHITSRADNSATDIVGVENFVACLVCNWEVVLDNVELPPSRFDMSFSAIDVSDQPYTPEVTPTGTRMFRLVCKLCRNGGNMGAIVKEDLVPRMRIHLKEKHGFSKANARHIRLLPMTVWHHIQQYVGEAREIDP